MRTIIIDFTAENILPNGNTIGKQGEHNATELIIKPPAEMLNYENLKYISVVFSVGTMRITSEPIEASEEIRLILSRAYTSVNIVSVQLEGYDGNDNLLVKSERIEDLIFETSIGGTEKDVDNSAPLSQAINLNTLARHTHENKDVLALIGQEGGNLTFDGKEITASGTGNTRVMASQVAAELLTTSDVKVTSGKPSEAKNDEIYANFFIDLLANTYLIFVSTEDGKLQCFTMETFDYTETIDVHEGEMLIWYCDMGGELTRYSKQGKAIRDVLINGLESLSEN